MTAASTIAAPTAAETRKVLAASTAGTVFEWYDFFIFGVLASIIAEHFFAAAGETAGLVFALATFAVGFIARPFGALVFGKIGDAKGRKGAFLATLLIMGVSTILIGLLPDYGAIGIAAPILLVILRLLQGFAIGGEYGGAVVYVAEHARADNRGFLTSIIQSAASAGLILALGVILATRLIMGEEAFRDWGWRVPFILSAVILAIAIYIRVQLEESPAFRQMKAEGRTARAPLKEAFLHWPNLRLGLIALFGIMAANGVIWYTAYFYVQFFLERVMRVEALTVNLLLITVAIIAAPAYVLFGWLTDKVGRKPIMLAGVLGSIVAMVPAFTLLAQAANPALMAAKQAVPIVVVAPAGTCTSQFDPLNRAQPRTACEAMRMSLARSGIPYTEQVSADGSAYAKVADAQIAAPQLDDASRKAFEGAVRAQFAERGHPLDVKATPNVPILLAVMIGLAMLAAMIYGPLAAALAELFPARIRYSGLSLPYHLGSGWLGGVQPAASFAIVASTGDPFAGLWYPLIVAGIGAVVAILFVPETRHRWLA